MSHTVILKLTCAIVVAGEILRKDSLVEVTQSEAKDLLNRGRAVLHDHDPESGASVFSSGSTDGELHPELESLNQTGSSDAATLVGHDAAPETVDAGTLPAAGVIKPAGSGRKGGRH